MNINSMNEMGVSQFLEKLASKEPTPGGGGAAALAGAVGIALGNMVGSLTVGKKKYASVEEEIIELNKRSDKIRKELYGLIERDAQAFMPVSKAYGIPKDDPARDDIMEDALMGAALVPIDIMKKSCEALEVIKEYAEKGSVLALSDAGCAASMCKASLEAAALNVFINTKSMKNKKEAMKLNEEVNAILDNYCKVADEIYDSVARRLR